MSLPRQRRGETIALVLKPTAKRRALRPSRMVCFFQSMQDRSATVLLVAGVALTMLALVESARAAPPPRPELPSHAERMTAGELKILTTHGATYRNRDAADPVSYTVRPDGTLTVFLNGGKQIHEGKWAVEADQFCLRIGWFYKSCSEVWRLGEASYFFWGDDEDETSSLAHNTYDRVK